MRLAVFIEPQLGASYPDQLRVAQHAEQLGFEAFFRSDHFLTMGTRKGLPGPTDSWATLAALAVQTSRIRLGTLLTSATFRHPGLLAITVAQVDQMSNGRIELGLGAGWFQAEHDAYGVPFPAVKERFDRLEEQLAIVTGLWTTPLGDTFSFDGKHYRLTDSPALPKPAQSPRPPIIVGGSGPKRTPELAARFADEFNVPFRSLDSTREVYARVTEACERAGRTMPVLSVAQTVAIGRTDAEAKRRADAIGGPPPVHGTPGEVVEQLGRFAEAGATRAFLQILDLSDLDHLDVIAAEIMPQV
jgi:F420-dependent oxidoreductase-like protein